MRPPRPDIAAPPFPPGTAWVGGPEPRLDRLVAARPLLVHFFDLAQLNSLRTLPYLRAWRERYANHGLGILGVHTPRFAFTRSAEAVAAALPRLEVDWPVAVDRRHAIWRDYGAKGWPSLFLWGRGGALRWYHLGEGEYRDTEQAIRDALEEAEVEADWPAPLEPLRPSDAPGAKVMPPSPELFPGGSPESPWTPAGERSALEVSYEAAGAYAAVEGEGLLLARLDGERLDPIEVGHPGLYEIADHQVHGAHRLELSASKGIAIHSVQFAAGPPGIDEAGRPSAG